MNSKDIRLYELTYAQRRVLFTQIKYSNSHMFNIGGTVTFSVKEIDFKRLKKAICSVVNVHDVFRINIVKAENEFNQIFTNNLLDQDNIEEFLFNDRKECERFFSARLQEKINLLGSPLYSFAVYSISDKEIGYFIKTHHIISDGWSMKLLTNHIYQEFLGLSCDTNNKLIGSSYKTALVEEKNYLASGAFIKNKEFWKSKLYCDNYQLFKIVNDVKAVRDKLFFDSKLADKISAFCKSININNNIFWLTLYLIYVKKITGKNELIVGIPVTGRYSANSKQTVGMYTNCFPLIINLQNEIKMIECFKMVKKQYMSSIFNSKYPFNLMRNTEHHKQEVLFDTCINYYGTKLQTEINGQKIENCELFNGEQEYSLQTIVREWAEDGSIEIDIDYKTEAFSAEFINSYKEALIEMVNQIDSFCLLTIHGVNIVSKEYLKTIQDYNSLGNLRRDYNTISDMLYKSILKNLNRVAVAEGEKEITYSKLLTMVNCIMNSFRGLKIKKGEIVAVIMQHSIETVYCVVAMLCYGIIILPIDPNTPSERINYILKDSGCKKLLTNVDIELGISIKSIYRIEDLLSINGKYDFEVSTTYFDTAYIIYTSGTTGVPKGVIIEHKSLYNYVTWAISQYGDNNLIFPFFTSLSFDFTFTSLLLPLLTGGKVEVYVPNTNKNILQCILEENKCNAIKLTPSHIGLLKDFYFEQSNISLWIFGGEKLYKQDIEELLHIIGKGEEREVNIYNEYGPTEATIGCMIYKITSQNCKSEIIPIGKPINNTQIYVMDKERKILPRGITGDIYISGICLAKGYINNPELTKQKFVFCNGKRMYNSGDQGYFTGNNTIVYVGREDRQIKLHGNRIEISEIENNLLRHQDLTRCYVSVCSQEDRNMFLCVYYTTKNKKPIKELNKYLAKVLPNYMIPSIFCYIDGFPLTVNGKIDCSKLPEPNIKSKNEKGKEDNKEFLPILSTILEKPELQLYDNFFLMGGDSIKAIRFASKISHLGYNIGVDNILKSENIADILSNIKQEDVIEDYDRERNGDLQIETPIMSWFRKQMIVDWDKYSQTCELVVKRNLTVNEVNDIVEELLIRHPVFHIKYEEDKNIFTYNKDNKVFVHCLDVSKCDINKGRELIAEKKKEIQDSICVENGKLFSIGIFSLSENKSILFICINHLAVDGVSWRIILDEINEMLLKQKTVFASAHRNSSCTYQYYSEQMKLKGVVENAEWKKIISKDFMLLEDAGKEMYCIDFENKSLNWSDLRLKMCNQMSVEEFLFCVVCLSVREMWNENEIVIEVEGHGRDILLPFSEVANTVGWFTTRYPVCINAASNDINYLLEYIKKIFRQHKKEKQNYLKYLQENNLMEPEWFLFDFLGEITMNYENFSVKNIGMSQTVKYLTKRRKSIELHMMIIDKALFCNILIIKSENNYIQAKNFIKIFNKKISEVIKLFEDDPENLRKQERFSESGLTDLELESLFLDE